MFLSYGDYINSMFEKYSQDIALIQNKVKELNPAFKVQISGVWVWIETTKEQYTTEVKKAFKELSIFWSPTKKLWYWRPAEMVKRRKKKDLDFGEIKETFGFFGDEIQTN